MKVPLIASGASVRGSTFGRRIEWDVAGVTRHGVAEDVDETGALMVRDGATRARVISGEVRWLS